MRDKMHIVEDLVSFIRNETEQMIQQTHGSELMFNVFTTQVKKTSFQSRLCKEASNYSKASIKVWTTDADISKIDFALPYIYETPFKFNIAPNEMLGLAASNIDYGDGLAACADGVLQIIKCYNDIYKNSHVTVVGRGHALGGLSEALIHSHLTFSLCNRASTYSDMLALFGFSDVIVWGVGDRDIRIPPARFGKRAILVDICGAPNIDIIKEMNPDLEYISPSQVGELTATILFNRAARYGGI